MIRGLTCNANTGEIVIARGDKQTIRFPVVDYTGAALNVSAASFKFTVKNSIDDDISAALFQLQNPEANGIKMDLAASGIVDVIVPASYTQAYSGAKVYDLQMTLTGAVQTVSGGVFRIAKQVSTPGTAGTPGAVLVPFPGSVSIDGELYLKDTITGLYSGFRVENGELKQSVAQSATLPFTW